MACMSSSSLPCPVYVLEVSRIAQDSDHVLDRKIHQHEEKAKAKIIHIFPNMQLVFLAPTLLFESN